VGHEAAPPEAPPADVQDLKPVPVLKPANSALAPVAAAVIPTVAQPQNLTSVDSAEVVKKKKKIVIKKVVKKVKKNEPLEASDDTSGVQQAASAALGGAVSDSSSAQQAAPVKSEAYAREPARDASSLGGILSHDPALASTKPQAFEVQTEVFLVVSPMLFLLFLYSICEEQDKMLEVNPRK
jgi:hypothetical protein